jgi:hypothetical protein
MIETSHFVSKTFTLLEALPLIKNGNVLNAEASRLGGSRNSSQMARSSTSILACWSRGLMAKALDFGSLSPSLEIPGSTPGAIVAIFFLVFIVLVLHTGRWSISH